jgi:hypothetical protein
MFPMFNAILDGLTFKDLAGKRQPRAFTVLTGLILLIVSMAGGLAFLNRIFLMSKVQATPVPLSLTAGPTQSVEVPQSEPTQQAVEIWDGCPTNAEDWSFSPTYNGQPYNVIQPACVYQGLEKTMAWALAVREGYSRAEATQQLGFTEMPMRRLDQVTIPFDGRGLADVPVSFIPPNPDLTEWRLKENGEAAVTYALRGCFRTSTVEGNRVEIWGGDYSVICLVVEDAENTHIIYFLNGHAYTAPATPMRSFLLFGYLKDGLWVWLGTQDDPKHEIKDPKVFANERLTIATMYDSQPWDAKWLSTYYHLEMQSPPENWQSLNDESEKQAILNALANEVSRVIP